MICFNEYKDKRKEFFCDPKKPGECRICDNEEQVVYVMYTLKGLVLHIKNIEKTAYARRKYESEDYHFGTEMLNHLLFCLENNDIKIEKITGILSWTDSENNWKDSIPFYDDFHKHLEKKLEYKLKFHLFENDDYTSEVSLSSDRAVRKLQIEEFICNHNNPRKDASFSYEVIR